MSLNQLRWALRNALADAEVSTAVIGIDVSMNEHLTADFRPHWVLHSRVFLPTMLSAPQVTTFRAHFPVDELIPRPLRIAQFDGDLAGIAYGMKPQFERRQSYEQVKSTADGMRKCRNTRGRPLRGSEAVELAVFLDEIGLRRRLILHGTRLKQDRHGAIVIRPDRDSPNTVHR